MRNGLVVIEMRLYRRTRKGANILETRGWSDAPLFSFSRFAVGWPPSKRSRDIVYLFSASRKIFLAQESFQFNVATPTGEYGRLSA